MRAPASYFVLLRPLLVLADLLVGAAKARHVVRRPDVLGLLAERRLGLRRHARPVRIPELLLLPEVHARRVRHARRRRA